jgi:hypothetical protein
MSCNLFEEKIVAIGRGELLDAELKQQTLAHTETCLQCEERLHNEKVLNERLKAFAAISFQTSPMIEHNLREAFAAHIAKQNQVVVMMPRRQRGAWVIGGAIAASLLVVVGLFAQIFSSANRDLTGVVLTSDELVEFEKAIDENDWNDFVKVDSPDKRTSFYAKANPRNHQKPTKRDSSEEIRETEIATDFMPFMQDGSDEMPTNGQIVRVELPRSALVAFGLPVDVERGNEKITADVVMSEEGIARAIRFVHTSRK